MANRLHYLTRVAVLGAAAAVLMIALETPLPGFPDYLKYEPSEIPALVAALTMGPAAGFGVEVVKVVLFLASGRATSGLVGAAANLVAGVALVAAAGLAHRAAAGLPGWARGLLTLAGGTVTMAAVMAVANALVFLPLWGVPPEATWAAAMATVPFNLVKGVLSGTLSLAVYRRLQPWLAGARPHQQAA